MSDYFSIPRKYHYLEFDGQSEFIGTFNFEARTVVYEHKFWNDTKPMENLPAETTTKQLARDATLQAGETGLTCIDIEHWPLRGDSQVVTQSTAKYVQIAKWFHEISMK